jgi:hypothetical protein
MARYRFEISTIMAREGFTPHRMRVSGQGGHFLCPVRLLEFKFYLVLFTPVETSLFPGSTPRISRRFDESACHFFKGRRQAGASVPSAYLTTRLTRHLCHCSPKAAPARSGHPAWWCRL